MLVRAVLFWGVGVIVSVTETRFPRIFRVATAGQFIELDDGPWLTSTNCAQTGNRRGRGRGGKGAKR